MTMIDSAGLRSAAAASPPSVVTITLEDKDGKTLLHLEQAGFRSETDAAYVGAGFGWKKFLGNLDGILAGDKS